MTRQNLQNFIEQIEDWEYCYCRKCDRIRYSFELKATEQGIQCSKCGGYDLEAPRWISCPHEQFSMAVKCARGGRGVKKGEHGFDCKYRCDFRSIHT